METIKSYSDLQQSKKLAEILPLESADMFYLAGGGEPVFIGNKIVTYEEDDYYDCLGGPDVLCWSLAGLLGVLPKIGAEEPMVRKLYYASEPKERYIGEYSIANITSEYDNPVDACYELILKLNELNLL